MTTLLKNSELEMYKGGNTFFVVENNGTCLFTTSSEVKAKNYFKKVSNCRNCND